jgi:hypothetical protein
MCASNAALVAVAPARSLYLLLLTLIGDEVPGKDSEGRQRDNRSQRKCLGDIDTSSLQKLQARTRTTCEF